ncbi:hypothetical protein B0H67DRAFT_588954 [Lasiosphaeris hirsuta]|uniref:BZIP domain-containing protein n=1 Tax=Lasiosphaeris hirsuta TaxID=260670 RepID=A0AA40DLD0_9PEZI|nr:hypothetical protein B0H67DRAFT_588954 [Lasiosphaeris hirsuta]
MEPFPDGSLPPFDPPDDFLYPTDTDNAAAYAPPYPLDFPLTLGDWDTPTDDDFSPAGIVPQQDATLSTTFVDPTALGLPLGFESDRPLACLPDWYDENAPLWIPSPYQHGALVPTPGYQDWDSAVRDWPGPSPLGNNTQYGDGEYFGSSIDSAPLPAVAGLASGSTASSMEPSPGLPTSPETQIAFSFDSPPSKMEKKRGRPRYYTLQDDNESDRPATVVSPSAPSLRRASTKATGSGFGSGSGSGSGGSGKPFAKSKVNDQERNRKASSARHRNKTQAASDDLEGEEREARTQNQSLRACAHHLRNEVIELRNRVLQQATCGCPLIEGYISTEAHRVAHSMTRDGGGHSFGERESESRWVGGQYTSDEASGLYADSSLDQGDVL